MTTSSVNWNEKAREDAKIALVSDPNRSLPWRDLGDALLGLGAYKEAVECYETALKVEPDNLTLWKNRGTAMRAIGEFTKLPAFAQDLNSANAWAVRAGRFLLEKRFGSAVEASDRGLALDAGNIAAARVGIHSRLLACDWRKRWEDEARIADGVQAKREIVTPSVHRAICDSEAEGFQLAQLWAKGFSSSALPLYRGEVYHHQRVRICYLSSDFRDHVVADAIVGCFERHDKQRFDTTAISLAPDDGSEMRRRLGTAFERFVDAQAMTNLEVANLMRELEIDIAIDLNGYSGARRSGILAYRPAPVQVNYLGFGGTMGSPSYDYIIADRIVIPEENQKYFSENVVRLPHCYMPNDDRRPISDDTPSRTEAGLPETSFVFACHNTEYKIGPQIFDSWMRILKAIDGSVLWLKAPNSFAITNLRHEAMARGVEPDRLIFAPRETLTERHLARLRCADLFLDTLPYNAHATGCDALWAGLPVLTCLGNTFAGRVAASELHAIGLSDLVSTSLAGYEALAIALARDPGRLAAIRAKLRRNRETAPLFDTARLTRNLEQAYLQMWERQQSGRPPEAFSVADVSAT